MMNPIRARLEGTVIALAVSLKIAKDNNKRGLARQLTEALERAEATADRGARLYPDAFRSHQLALAMFDGIVTKRVPSYCEQLARRIAGSLNAHAQPATA